MRLAVKLWIAYAVFWLVVANAAAVSLLMKFPYFVYFAVPFVLIGSIGVVPASYALLFIRFRSWPVRLATAGVYVVLLAGVWQTPPLYRSRHEAPHDQGPYLSWAGDPNTTMTVSWTTAAAKPSWVEYAPAGEQAFKEAADPSDTHFHHVTIKGLKPDTDYVYRVRVLGAETHTFRTAPEQPADFSFVVYGDNRPWGGITRHAAVIRAMKRADGKANFRFLINIGDLVENPGPGYGWQWYVFLKHIAPFAATRPYLISLGNHEARGTTEHYEKYFDFGTNDFWYSLDYAGVHFVFLSTQHDSAPESEQYQWLVADLEAHAPASRFTVVSLHKPLLSYDPREGYRKNDERRAHLAPVFERCGVDIVFAGHVHAYEHHMIGNLHHVITGGGGVLLWSIPGRGPETIATETCFHFCEVHVKGNTMTVQAKRLNGSIIEEFRVQGSGFGVQGLPR